MIRVMLLENVENYGKKGEEIVRSNEHADYLIRKGLAKFIRYENDGCRIPERAELICGDERPPRLTFCQLKKGHKGSHRAVVFWE